jgi:hypothetical protein
VILIFPFGVKLHVCVALPPAAVFAVTVNEFAIRDCACVGVQETVFAPNVALKGPDVSANVTALPSGDVAIGVYVYVIPSSAAIGGVLVNVGVAGIFVPPPPPQPIKIFAATNRTAGRSFHRG